MTTRGFDAAANFLPTLERRAADVTIREYFAGLAMQGLLASPANPEHPRCTRVDFGRIHAEYAVECADALIAELAKGRT